MKTSDFIHRFPTGVLVRRDGLCRVRCFVTSGSQCYVLLTDLGEMNPSASITNSLERVCESLRARGSIPESCDFIEHYETRDHRDATFDFVKFDDQGSPRWDSISKADVLKLLECEPQELDVLTQSQPRLLDEIDRMRSEIDPFVGSPWPESSEVTKRRNDIEAKMISKRQVVELVERGAGEQELQRLLKQDLSMFAEIYADPKDEYICFSELPVADGAVDFVVFSGTSRMDVTLIEIKGSEFFLVNRGHYEKFASKIDEAVCQIRKRLRVVIDEIKEFRAHVHRVRKSVEKGTSHYNSLLGPIGYLEVDPNKDLNIRCVVIGGRTRNDLEESKARHELEWNTHPPIRVESWDTWLRKVRRE